MRTAFRMMIVRIMLATAAAPTAALAQPALPYPPPPPLRAEVVPAAPGARYAWEPGHWQWQGGQYAWIGGRHVVRRARWTAYEPGRWVLHRHAWRWDPAHWR